MKNWTLALALGAAATTTMIGFGVNPASAGTLTWSLSFDIDTNLLPPGKGPTLFPTPVKATVITEDTLSLSPVTPGFKGYKVLSITGTQGTSPFTEKDTGPIIGLLDPGTTQIGGDPSATPPIPPIAALNDNLFNPNGVENPGLNTASAFFSQGGLAYNINEKNTTPPTVDPYQVFYDATSQTYMGCLHPCVTVQNLDVKLVPEPSSTAGLLAIGSFGALGAASTLKRKLKPSKSDEN
ncbi:PEP-CTERM sorting domain-containing protein [Microcystis wesenbergii FACHB-1317]|uniref:PEP-CTERM sorting domain-containing protein n=1 Tax=Microcystis TaxID=1125 RepID=UPI000E38ACA0|nr:MULTISPECIES: PEP-CTERM sorting domain-containing protein [Microcystis]MBD2289467.1 PEP-CTERM sorting domain-containing protein [Microcystis wesenbergii FACHB-1317]REJ42449.1 MAG: PEP-CTERM sorting domain-containing protein [Microcystis aeruginosa TA09]UZO77176.1 PEP-CTERM sorting domain-containing protein [Microcystis aeruginosa str. Chao 1910]